MKGVWGIKGPQEAGARGEVPRIVAERPDQLRDRPIRIWGGDRGLGVRSGFGFFDRDLAEGAGCAPLRFLGRSDPSN
jgi:hypothetical protein